MAELRVGMVGLGHMCLEHVLPLFPCEMRGRFVLQAVCDLSREVADAVGEQYGVVHSTTDFDELIARDDVDVVALYTPETAHADQIVSALKAGKHVICTKPMTTSLDACYKITEAARNAKTLTLVGQTCRWFSPFQLARGIVESGQVGDLLGLEARYVHDLRHAPSLGAWRVGESAPNMVYHGVCHPIDTARWFGGDIVEVHAIAGNSGTIKDYSQEENFFINVRFKSGLIGTVIGAYGVVEPPNGGVGLNVYGSKGSIAHIESYDTYEVRVSIQRNGHVETERLKARPERIHQDAVLAYFGHLYDCLQNNQQPMTNVIDNAKTISACAAILESVRTGKPAEVANDF